MKFATLTLNPCLDKTMYFSSFCLGKLNRAVENSNLMLGSKGINVSRVFNILGVDCCAIAFSGGRNGSIMEDIVRSENLNYKFVQTRAETRMNVKIIDTATGICTEANERGGPIDADECADLESAVYAAFDEAEYFFLGGSIPPGMDKSVYSALIAKGREKGVKMILDCDGAALVEGASLSPYLIKPNLFELGHLCGETLELEYDLDGAPTRESIGHICGICADMSGRYKTKILCTMSGDGAIYSDGEQTYYHKSHKVTVRGFTGAGDTFLTAFMYIFTGCSDVTDALNAQKALAFASSAAAAKVELEGTTLPEKDMMYKFM